MFQELKFQLSTAILTLLTIAAGVSAVINLQQQTRFRLPDDGAIWVDRPSGVVALDVAAGRPAAKAGIHTGDILVSINGSSLAAGNYTGEISIIEFANPGRSMTVPVNLAVLASSKAFFDAA